MMRAKTKCSAHFVQMEQVFWLAGPLPLTVLPVVRPKAKIRPFQHFEKIRPEFRPESAEIPPKNTFFLLN